ncbi:hypothetical protein PO124_20540 [Bacillus licheniformis]|nr:hypothetical protein [Bacillus licheniformis]
MAAEDSVPNNETTLTSASPVEASFQSDDEVHWYKVNPSNQEIANYTHFRVKLKSDAELNISVYSSLEMQLVIKRLTDTTATPMK